jgi:DNA-binding transcriptional ArsR family regulator
MGGFLSSRSVELSAPQSAVNPYYKILLTIEILPFLGYIPAMRTLPHPERNKIELPSVLEALSDPTRLGVVAFLAALPGEPAEARCGEFVAFGSKQNLTYHLARLREAGVTQTRIAGTARYISLRTADLEARFPGLLTSVIGGARSDPARVEIVDRALAEAKVAVAVPV